MISLLSIAAVLLLLLLSLATPSLSQKCNSKDRKAIFEIKAAFGSPYNSWTNNTDCCSWYNVQCDPITRRIISLTINHATIFGQIPTAIGNLPFLQILILRKFPNLTGEIPIALSKLTHLKVLRLSWNNLSGPVPLFLSQLKNLTYLDLAFNNLSGTIPPSLSQLQNLDAIHLDRNKLTGTIPDSFGKFTGKTPDLYLSHNQLTGTVPKSLGNLNFTVIDLSRNQLVGDLSFLFGTSKILQTLDFSRNAFVFDFTKVKLPSILLNLDFNHNKVFGSLPKGLIGLNLQFMNVSYNRLCGKIPQGGNLGRFSSFEFFQNKCLCGPPLPAC